MKKIAFLLFLLSTPFFLFAQNLIATLQHGDDISAFYGSNAFIQAHEAAYSGDIITLSSGTFNLCDITKGITIRGAGCVQDSVTNTLPTVFSTTNVFFNVPQEEGAFSVEGIYFAQTPPIHKLFNPRFIKCHLGGDVQVGYLYETLEDGTLENAQFVNCFIDNYEISEHNVQILNSVIYSLPYWVNNYSGLGIVNSIVFTSGSINMALFQNSIIISYYGDSSPTSMFQNCIGIGYGSIFDGQENNTNWLVSDCLEVFESYNGEWTSFEDLLNEQFILKSDVATSFLGTDGTEVGIHGGSAPYKLRPNYMVMKRCNVATQSTVDNKLSVEIEVVAEGE